MRPSSSECADRHKDPSGGCEDTMESASQACDAGYAHGKLNKPKRSRPALLRCTEGSSSTVINMSGSKFHSTVEAVDSSSVNLHGDTHNYLSVYTNGKISNETAKSAYEWLLGTSLLENPAPSEDSHEGTLREATRERLPCTGDWVLEKHELETWLARDDQGPTWLWINAFAGFGKSFLCARITQHLTEDLGIPVALCSFNSLAWKEQDASVFLYLWIWQLAKDDEEVMEMVLEEAESSSRVNKRVALQLLHRILEERQRHVLVVDGLDVCPAWLDKGGSVDRLLEDLRAFLPARIPLLIVSRDEPHIRRVLGASNAAVPKVSVLTLTPSDNREDRIALSNDLIERKIGGRSTTVKMELSKRLVENSAGQMLWLKLQEPALDGWKTTEQLRQAVSETPSQLFKTYDITWKRINALSSLDKKRALNILLWATFSLRPLTVGEIAEAALINDAVDDLSVGGMSVALNENWVQGEIERLVSPLLKIDRSTEGALHWTVNVTHFTVQEYLAQRLPLPPKREANREDQSKVQNALLARLCLHYIRFSSTWDGTSSLSPNEFGFHRYFRSYAAGTWYQHIEKANGKLDVDTLELVQGFMTENSHCWKPWREWYDAMCDDETHDDETHQTRENGLPRGPFYYATKLDKLDLWTGRIAADHHETRLNGPLPVERGPAIHYACETGNLRVVRTLLNAGTSVEIRGENNRTPLLTACRYNHTEVAELLIERNADLNAVNSHRKNSLHAAVDNQHLEMTRLLVDRGASLGVFCGEGWLPVHAAARRGRLDILELLLPKVEDINVLTKGKTTMVHIAASNGHHHILKALAERGANVNKINIWGTSALHNAVGKGYCESLRVLLDHGADIDRVNEKGLTAAHIAVFNDDVHSLQLLASRGANLNLKDSSGLTVILAAKKKDLHEIVSLYSQGRYDRESFDEVNWGRKFWEACRGDVTSSRVLLNRGVCIQLVSSTGQVLEKLELQEFLN